MAKIPEISEHNINEMLDMIMDLKPLKDIAKYFGFSSLRVFQNWIIDNPEIMARFENAKHMACINLEDELLNVADNYTKDVARTKLDAITRLLKFRDPKKYGDKLDLSVTTVDISGSLDRAEQRMIDVTPIIPKLKPTS